MDMISEKDKTIVDAVNQLGVNIEWEYVRCIDGDVPVILHRKQQGYVVGTTGYQVGFYVFVCTVEEYNQCIKEMSEGAFVPNASKAVKAKTVTSKVMLFDKPYEFTVCYYTETFELVSAFENKMNQSVMWSQPIKDLIINELKNGVDKLSRITHDDKFPLYNAYRDNVNAQREFRG